MTTSGGGCILDQIRAWIRFPTYMSEFPKTLILFSEELNVAAEKTMRRIHDFIGVTENSNIDYNVRYNVNGTYKNKMVQYLLGDSEPIFHPITKNLKKNFR